MKSADHDDRSTKINNIIQSLRVVFKTIQLHSREIEKQCGLSGAMLWMLWELSSTPGLKVSELAVSLSIHVSTCSNMLDKLQARGFVMRARNDTDQRTVRIYLTDAGTALLAAAPQPAQGKLSAAIDKLTDVYLDGLDSSLEQLLKRMQITDKHASLTPLVVKDDAY